VTAVKWLEVHIDTNHTGLEPVETMLSALGIDGVVIDDETEFEDFLENNRQYWDYPVRLLILSMKRSQAALRSRGSLASR